jgi:hypothetical protein
MYARDRGLGEPCNEEELGEYLVTETSRLKHKNCLSLLSGKAGSYKHLFYNLSTTNITSMACVYRKSTHLGNVGYREKYQGLYF